MSEKNNELESLSRLREIIFGEQMAQLEEKIYSLSSDSKVNIEKLSDEFKNLLSKQKEAFEAQLKELGEKKADSKTIADTLRKLADEIDGETKNK